MDMTIAQLVEQTGVASRTLREWIRLELLPRPAGNGPAALYSRDHLLRIWAILALRRDGLGLADTKEQLAAMSPREMARYRPKRTPAPPPPAEAGADPAAGTPSAEPPAPRIGPTAASPRLESAAGEGTTLTSVLEVLPGRRYALVQLMPGLVLMVDEGVSGFVRRTALEIVERYAATTG
ncbi:MAG TPA: MerR family transcriptional regulator [Polyangiaceae bacterium]